MTCSLISFLFVLYQYINLVTGFNFPPKTILKTTICNINYDIIKSAAISRTKLHLLKENDISPTDAVSSRMDSTFSSNKLGMVYEEDINFCLRKSDTALSGISRSKVLNELTNNVMRALIIGYEPIIQDLFQMFDKYREQVDITDCFFDEEDLTNNAIMNTATTDDAQETDTATLPQTNIKLMNEDDAEVTMVKPIPDNSPAAASSLKRVVPTIGIKITSNEEKKAIELKICSNDLKISRDYVDRLEKLLQTGFIQESSMGGIYDRGYKRLLTILRDAGCLFPSSSSSSILSDIKTNNYIQRPKPEDQDICLSILDKTTLLSSTNRTNSKTKILNSLSNVVFRAVLYGRKHEKRQIIRDIGSNIPGFAQKWTKNDINSQEILFLKTLQLLLSQGLQVAGSIIANRPGGNLNLNQVISSANNNDIYNSNSNTNTTPPPVAPTITGDVASGTTSINGVNFLGLYSNTAKNGEIDNITPINDIISNRLYDTYQNAFYRIIEACFSEIGKRSGDMLPQNEDVLLSIASWEKNVRNELTNGLWIRNPSELVGNWILSDISVGSEGAESIMSFDCRNDDEKTNKKSSSTEMNKLTTNRSENIVNIELCKDGQVNIDNPEFVGVTWVSTPGPAHLDTVEFTLNNRQNENSILKYVGFIDRGQRIESRFSLNPIRMTGRVLSLEHNVMRGSNRFVMKLPRKLTPGSSSIGSGGGKGNKFKNKDDINDSTYTI